MSHIWFVNRKVKGAAACCPKDRVIHSLKDLERILL